MSPKRLLVSLSFLFAIGHIQADESLALNEAALAKREAPNKSTEQMCPQACGDQKKKPLLQGNALDGQYSPAYNAPAVVDVCHKMYGNVNGFADASFLYWYGGEEGLSVASDGVMNTGVAYFAENMKDHYQTFNYHPGFRVGIGAITEREWMFSTHYTWLRGRNNKHFHPQAGTFGFTAGTTAAVGGTPILLVDDWFLMGTSSGQALAASRISSTWSYGVDLLDATASRPFYQGRTVTVTPFGGLRAAWIRQSMRVALTEASVMFGSALPTGSPNQPIVSHNFSHSWGIGPRFGLESDCQLPMGFRIEGDLAASLLYTRYTKVSHTEDKAAISFNGTSYKAHMNDYDCLRPMAELGLGAGWGRYLYCKDYHVDISASYDFTLMWNQNMMRKLLDDVLTGTGSDSSDLYFHGLTIKARFDY